MVKKLLVLGLTATLVVGALVMPAEAKKRKVKPPVTFESSGSLAMTVVGQSSLLSITSNEFRNTCSIPASQGVDGYVVELSDAISAVTSTVVVSGSDATGFGHDFDMYFFDADCTSTGEAAALTAPATGDASGVFPAGTKYVLVIAGGGPGLEFTLHASEKR